MDSRPKLSACPQHKALLATPSPCEFAGVVLVSLRSCRTTHAHATPAVVSMTRASYCFATRAMCLFMRIAWGLPAQSRAIGFAASVRISPPTPKATRAKKSKPLLPRAREQEGEGGHAE